ncbi:hypothetical protein ACIGHJ_22160 [Stutzerimonas kunmingensis]|uniref:hypothetical protein n=1 Tax=Stutzerimonas kunmingensis TaxID=1211807 RepID=UPI0037D987E7
MANDVALRLTGWRALRQRLLEDVLSIPFFWLWALLLGTVIQYSGDEKINDFFVNMHEEGVALKSMVSLFVVSLIATGLAMLCCPSPNGNWIKLLRAPARTGRSMSITTLAFILGAAPVLGVAEGSARMLEMLGLPIFGCLLIWAILFTLDSCAIQAKSWSTTEHHKLSNVGGWACTVVGGLSPVLLFWQIHQGAYASIAS